MVRKLLKYEIKDSWLELVLINAGILLFSILCSTFMDKFNVLFALSLISLFLFYTGAAILLLITVIRSFNQKLFTSEGYLTLTLPVNTDQLLFSKIFINLFRFFITAVSFILSILIIVTRLSKSTDVFIDFFIRLAENPDVVLIVLFNSLLTALYAIVILIFVLSCLNCGKIKKYKLLLGFLIYYGVNLVSNWIKTLVYIIPYQVVIKHNKLDIIKGTHPLKSIFAGQTHFSILNFNNVFWTIIFIVTLYMISRYIIKNKIELE
ncbi:MAG TPA: hypothetical protein GXZ48_00430 [Acholeplasmataceae bacterium]|nr:hypothetical protein [Acholeplasmataceae bacterium]